MFGFLRRRKQKGLKKAEEEGRRSAEECMAACKEVWLELNSPAQTNDAAALSQAESTKGY